MRSYLVGVGAALALSAGSWAEAATVLGAGAAQGAGYSSSDESNAIQLAQGLTLGTAGDWAAVNTLTKLSWWGNFLGSVDNLQGFTVALFNGTSPVAAPEEDSFEDEFVAIDSLTVTETELTDGDGYAIYRFDWEPTGINIAGGSTVFASVVGRLADLDSFYWSGADLTDPHFYRGYGGTGWAVPADGGVGEPLAMTLAVEMSFEPFDDSDPGPAVPEPGTWAMLILGFGLVGGALRRRRQGVAVVYA